MDRIGIGLTDIGSKSLYLSEVGKGEDAVVFIHGLGGNHVQFSPIINSSISESHRLIFYDLDGHGMSPIGTNSEYSLQSYAEDLRLVLVHSGVTKVSLVAHSMGCLVAMSFATRWPEAVKKLVLLGPPPCPLPEPGRQQLRDRAAIVRKAGTVAIVDAIVAASTSQRTKETNPLALSLVRMSVLFTQPEGYAQACVAFAGTPENLDLGAVQARTLVITGVEDKVSPPGVARGLAERIPSCEAVVLADVGHQHVWEDTTSVMQLLSEFL